MRVFSCQNCGQLLHFENTLCLQCGSKLGFVPELLTLSTCIPNPDGILTAAVQRDRPMKRCANYAKISCNWLVAADSKKGFCLACDLNRTIPDLDTPGNLKKWDEIEAAKRRVVYTLRRLGLKTGPSDGEDKPGLQFDFLADEPGEPVLTGHFNGLVTINIAEADSAEREKRRQELGELYRTMLGHLRHEVGHYYWDLLVRNGGRIDKFRAVFGDESESYGAALKRHYAKGPPDDWQSEYVSAYATMHPWEDFAETWSHYLHMVDTLDTAASFGMIVDPLVSNDIKFNAKIEFDPYGTARFFDLIRAWIPMTVAMNSLNRSMGQRDLYPFALSNPAIRKLCFIHDLVRGFL